MQSKFKTTLFFRAFTVFVLGNFFLNSVILPSKVYAQNTLNLPTLGVMITPSISYSPAIITGMTIHPENPLQFDFIVDTGDDHLQGEILKNESKKLINYFMATLTVPEDEMWVNLSPYEKNRIIADGLSKTEMGRDMLAQDYLLKQLTASLMYPEGKVGQEFWQRVYAKAQEKFNTQDIPTDLFNKVWIIPQKATVFINGNNIFVTQSHLRVMLEQDYLALEENQGTTKHGIGNVTKDDIKTITGTSAQIIREVILPEIEKEINEGKNFASLRQIYNSIILATWYKKKLKNSFLGEVYFNENKTDGIELEDKNVKEEIYNQYLEAFKKGVYNYIKEDYDAKTQEVVSRKYFSGGILGGAVAQVLDESKTTTRLTPKGDVVTISTYLEPTKVVDQLQQLLNVIAKSNANSLSQDAPPSQIIEYVLGQLKEQDLIKEKIEDGNAIIAINEEARFTKLGRAIDKWVINPEEGYSTKAINLKSSQKSNWKGSWLIVGFENDLEVSGILKHEQREIFYRKQNPDEDWRLAHNKAVEESGVGDLILIETKGSGEFQGTERLAAGIGDWVRRKKLSLTRRFNHARNRKPELTGNDTRRIDTDMTLNYGGLQKWGYERIMIDLVQNHAPADARGTKVEVKFHLKDGRTMLLHDKGVNNLKASDVESIEISDDGIGYDYNHLKYFLTTKGSIEEAGKFGEGLKIATAAGILRGMQFEFHSRGWKAVPFIETAILNEGHPNEIETNYISFAVSANGQREGSSTFIKNPSRYVIETVKKLPNLVLLLRENYTPMAKVSGIGEIVERGSTVYVKGNRVIDVRNTGQYVYPSLFSYNIFDDTELNRDRDFVPERAVNNVAKEIFLNGVTPEVAKIVIEAAKERRGYYETKLSIYSYEIQKANGNALDIWREVFYDLYGQDAILGKEKYGDFTEVTLYAMKEGRNVVVMMEGGIYEILASSGVTTTERLYAGKQLKDKEVEVATGVALDYRDKAWDLNRILLDAVQNHLFADSGATEIKVEFSDGSEWFDLSKVDNYRNRQIRAVRVRDNGHGYDYKLLGVFHSTKKSSYRAGQWGEGIKLLSAAALRNGLGIELKSRGWQAKAVEKTRKYEDADKKEISISVLGFDMVHLANEQSIQGSETIFTNLSTEFLNLVRELHKKVLILDKNYHPVSKTDVGEITSTSIPNIYVNGLEVKDEMNDHKQLLGYNFIGVNGLIASPDRNVINGERLKQAVGVMISQTDSPEAIIVVINNAIDSDDEHPEFVDVTKIRGFKNKETWRTAWDRVVNQRRWNPKKTVLATRRILTDPDAQILLRNMGYQIIVMNGNISPIIHEFGIHFDYEVLNPNFEYINTDDLTTQERGVLALTKVIERKVGEILNIDVSPSDLKIFTAVRSSLTGEELNGWIGVWDKRNGIVGVARSQLTNPIDFGRTYLEELGHRLSGAGDYTREFTNFFRNALLTQILKEEGIDAAMLGKEQTANVPGGIDFNPANLDLRIEGNELDIRLFQDIKELRGINIEGFTPFIFNVAPVINFPALLGLSQNNNAEQLSH